MSAMQDTQDWSLGREDQLEKELATYSSILAWKIWWTEEPGRLQSMVSQRVRHNWLNWAHAHTCIFTSVAYLVIFTSKFQFIFAWKTLTVLVCKLDFQGLIVTVCPWAFVCVIHNGPQASCGFTLLPGPYCVEPGLLLGLQPQLLVTQPPPGPTCFQMSADSHQTRKQFLAVCSQERSRRKYHLVLWLSGIF